MRPLEITTSVFGLTCPAKLRVLPTAGSDITIAISGRFGIFSGRVTVDVARDIAAALLEAVGDE